MGRVIVANLAPRRPTISHGERASSKSGPTSPRDSSVQVGMDHHVGGSVGPCGPFKMRWLIPDAAEDEHEEMD